MASDVWWNVLVMRVCAAERGLAGMRLRIVPVDFFRATPDLVTVADDLDYSIGEHQSFANYQSRAAEKITSPLTSAVPAPRRTTSRVE